ncbi:MAG: DUF1214 domain-containing protein [Hyphomonadaceae bacterium]
MLKRILFVLSVLVVGIGAGGGSAMLMISSGAMIGRVDNDRWFTSRTIGATDADPYTRALVARIGLLGLNRNETIYYTRTEDDSGQPFSDACIYRIEGGPLATRWWSVTLYAPDNFLAVNGDERHSIDATSVAPDADGRWSARIAAQQDGAENWISSRNGGAFSLSIRLYNPEPAIGDHLGTVALPHIVRESCVEGAE